MHIIHDPATPAAAPITFDDFLAVDIRAGTIIDVKLMRKARNPSYSLMIDFGLTIGLRRSVARLTENYAAGQLIGRQILAVVNLPPRQVSDKISEVLILGCPGADNAILLTRFDDKVLDGSRLS